MNIKNNSTAETDPKEGAFLAPRFWGQLPPRWAGRSPAFNDTFPSSNPTTGASTLGGAWWWERSRWRPRCRRSSASWKWPRPGMIYIFFFLLYSPPPPESNLCYGGGGEVIYRRVRGGGNTRDPKYSQTLPTNEHTNYTKTNPPKS